MCVFYMMERGGGLNAARIIRWYRSAEEFGSFIGAQHEYTNIDLPCACAHLEIRGEGDFFTTHPLPPKGTNI